MLRRTVLAAFLSGAVYAVALAAPPSVPTAASPSPEGVDDVVYQAMQQASGTPARINLGDQATVRLAERLYFVSRQPAEKLLLISGQPIPPQLLGLILGPDGMSMAGPVRFIPAGFIDPDAVLNWTPKDILASLQDTLEARNPARVQQGQTPLEARDWVQPPRYDRQTHQLAWAALIAAKNAPKASDGEVVYNAVAFGRTGFIQLSLVSSVEKANEVEHLTAAFLAGVTFQPGEAYADATPADRNGDKGLAQVMDVDSLHRAPRGGILTPDTLGAGAAGLLAAVAGGTLLLVRRRRARQDARRG